MPFSLIFFFLYPPMKSRVRVELEVSTREESVDIDAERTRIKTIAIRKSPKGRLSFLELKQLAGPQNQDLFIEVLRDMADRGIITAGDDGFRIA